MEEATIVDKAKRTHKETTQSAARAAKVSYPRLWMSTCYLTQGITNVTDTHRMLYSRRQRSRPERLLQTLLMPFTSRDKSLRWWRETCMRYILLG